MPEDTFKTLAEAVDAARSQLLPGGTTFVCRFGLGAPCDLSDEAVEACPNCIRVPFGDPTPTRVIVQSVIGGN